MLLEDWLKLTVLTAALLLIGLVGITPVGQAEHHDIYTTPDQLTEELLTLSLVPRSRWQTLLNLETIKVRRVTYQCP